MYDLLTKPELKAKARRKVERERRMEEKVIDTGL